MPDLTDLRTIRSALEHFSLPAFLGSLKDDSLVFWNRAFQKRAGVSDIKLAEARLTSLILLDENYSGLALQRHDSEHVIRLFDSCPACSKNLLPLSGCLAERLEEKMGYCWQCWIYRLAMWHSRALFTGA